MSAPAQAPLCRYHYDPLDRLAGTTVWGQADVLRFYQKNRLATEIQGAVRRSIVQHEDLLLAQQQRVDSTIETTLLGVDQQRSVLKMFDNSDTQSLTYNPYGHLPADSGLTSLLGFNGEHRDPLTGHYLLGNGYRAYNPVLMRFNNPDSLSPFREGGINGYAYCAGDPVNLVDPTGHISAILWRGIARTGFLKKHGIKRLARPAQAPTRAALAPRDVGVSELQLRNPILTELLERPVSAVASAPSAAVSSSSLTSVKSASKAVNTEANSLNYLKQKFYNYPKQHKDVRRFDASVPADEKEQIRKSSAFDAGETYFNRQLEVLKSSSLDDHRQRIRIGFLTSTRKRHSKMFTEFKANLAALRRN